MSKTSTLKLVKETGPAAMQKFPCYRADGIDRVYFVRKTQEGCLGAENLYWTLEIYFKSLQGGPVNVHEGPVNVLNADSFEHAKSLARKDNAARELQEDTA